MTRGAIMSQTLEMNFDRTLAQGNVKAAMREVSASKRDLWQVDPKDIRVIDGFNVRVKNAEYDAHIRSLADSIKLDGFYQDKPLGGYVALEGGKQIIYLHDGHCRLEAVLLAIDEGADVQRVPMVVSPAGTSMEDLVVSLVRSNSGKPLSTYETAIVCKRLSRYGWTSTEIARRLGFSSQQYVDSLLLLAAAPIQIRDMVCNGVVSASMAIDALQKQGDKAVDVLIRARDRAKGAGKNRVTAKFMPGAEFRKQVRKGAEQMWEAISRITHDDGYSHLSSETRQMLEKILGDIERVDEGSVVV